MRYALPDRVALHALAAGAVTCYQQQVGDAPAVTWRGDYQLLIVGNDQWDAEVQVFLYLDAVGPSSVYGVWMGALAGGWVHGDRVGDLSEAYAHHFNWQSAAALGGEAAVWGGL